MADYFFDYESGNNANSGLDFANRKKDMSAFTPTPGDHCKWKGSPLPTSCAIDATFTDGSPTLTLASALTANITVCDTAWTAAANVTATVTSVAGNYKEGTGACNLVFAAGFTTGLCAYFDLGSTIDFSAYGGISLWFQPTSVTGGLAYASWQIKLCSDAVGAVPVNTLNLPAALNGGAYHQLTVDNGGALSATVRSIALYATSDPGSATVRMDNIIAVKAAASADSLSLKSLVGKNTAGEAWYNIQSINGTAVILGGVVTLTAGSSNLRGYTGATATQTLYKREAITVVDNASQTLSPVIPVLASGTAAAPILISGGWDRTNMSTQDSETWFGAFSNASVGISIPARSFIQVSKFGLVEFFQGVLMTGASCFNSFTDCYAVGSFGIGVGGSTTSASNVYTRLKSNNNGNYGLVPGVNDSGDDLFLVGNATANINCANGGNNRFTNVVDCNSTNVGIDYQLTSGNIITTYTSRQNAVAGFRNYGGLNYIINPTITDATIYVAGSNNSNGRLNLMNVNATSTDNRIYTDGALIQSDTSNADGSVIGWRVDITGAHRLANYPVKIGGAIDPNGLRLFLEANQAVTIVGRGKKTHANAVATLMLRGGQIAGVPADVSASVAGTAGFEDLSLSFTPTASGWVELEFLSYTTDGVTTYSTAFARFVKVKQA